MEKSLLLPLLIAIAVTVVVSVPTKPNKRWDGYYDYWTDDYDYDWNDDYEYYDWYADDYLDNYDWNDWYDYYDCDLTNGNVKECISGHCVDINDICSGADSCSSMENEWFCTVYERGIKKANDSIKKRNLGENVDDKKLKTKVYQLITRKIKAAKQKKADNVERKARKNTERNLKNIKRLLSRKTTGLKQRMHRASEAKPKP
ncbi:DNA-directed RNA polymerase subunit beta'-like [Mytilus californianus]|uniref:DNA-directed RNA polymerase subunit beta'-like n=1 Tax=Mytilus californianus TaxID=6549 RepID=UPI002245329C|nr:DNA-directed RNA polymerase subunit beta'-like [Mytilus californianus]